MSSFFDYGEAAENTTAQEFVLLGGRDPEDWATLIERMERRRFIAGEVLLRIGERDRSLYILTAGDVEVLLPGRRNPRQIAVIRPGAVVGEVAFFDGEPRSATVRALTDGELLRLSPDAFDALAAHDPDLGRALLFDLGSVLARRLRRKEQGL